MNNIPSSIETTSASTVYRLYSLPSPQQLTSVLESTSFENNLTSFLEQTLKITLPTNINIHNLDTIPALILAQLSQRISHESIVMNFINLKKDFYTLRDMILEFRSKDTITFESAKMFKKASAEKLLAPEIFLPHLEPSLLAQKEDTFEIISSLEKIYLQILVHQVKHKGNTYFQNILGKKLETYNLMTIIKRHERGQSTKAIFENLIEDEMIYPLTKIRFLAMGDVVGEIGSLLQIPSEKISVNAIETALIQNEIKAINQAKFYGVGEERIFQYLEQVYLFITNLKLGLTETVLKADTTKVKDRMIDYLLS
jgi:hypothetical protein